MRKGLAAALRGFFGGEISRDRRVARLAKTPRLSPASWRPVFWRSEFQPVRVDPELPGGRGSGAGGGRTRGTASRPTRRPPVPTPEDVQCHNALLGQLADRRPPVDVACSPLAAARNVLSICPRYRHGLHPSAARRHQDRAPAGGKRFELANAIRVVGFGHSLVRRGAPTTVPIGCKSRAGLGRSPDPRLAMLDRLLPLV
jgi:hypothetical protein